MAKFKFECKSKHATKTSWKSWLPFAKLVTATFDNVPFPMKGILSKDSVMVIPFRYVNGKPYIGFIMEQRPLFCGDQWLAAFPAGKIEDNQSPKDAAQLESLQEGGIVIKNLKPVGCDADMPFLHICSEQVHLFTAEVKCYGKQNLEKGEWIANKLTWVPYMEFKTRIITQQMHGIPAFNGAYMKGVSLSSANKLIALEQFVLGF